MTWGFLTFGDAAIGMGHVFRCLSLARAAKAARPELKIEFLVDTGQKAFEILKKSGLAEVRMMPEDAKLSGEFEVLVVDRLETPTGRLQDLKRHARCLVCLDDAGPGHFMADISINALYPCLLPRPAGSVTDSRQGFEFLSLDPAFARAGYQVRHPVRELFLTQGGADTYGLVPKLVEGLAPWLLRHSQATLHIHTGPAFEFERELSAVLENAKFNWQRHRDIGDMPSLLAGMDVAVSSAGMMAFELASAGVPVILVTGESKEVPVASRLEACGSAVSLGYFDDNSIDRLLLSLDRLSSDEALRSKLSKTARKMIDGQGIERILAAIFQHIRG
ncbi:MAG: hypothetical protein EPN26_08075 [Rhodospirillales bacterium]|nr:MAG: hypothetical protein EPN26_08075 [Rhodospirillales bacterium]